MTFELDEKEVNIYEHPTETVPHLGSATIGDLHGNALKFVYFLLYNNVVRFKNDSTKKQDYAQFVEIYEGLASAQAIEDPDTKKAKLHEIINSFKDFMGKLEVTDQASFVRLIGDELADRGSNDYLTLKILEFLHANAVKCAITISNHSNDFITAYEKISEGKFGEAIGISTRQKPSFIGLQSLIEEGIVPLTDITKIVETIYKPTLKVIDYTLSDEGISLFTHAPVRFDIIKDLALKMRVVYNDSTAEALAKTIDQINKVFARVVQDNKVHELLDTPDLDGAALTPEQRQEYPLVHIIWNRMPANSDELDSVEVRPDKVNDFAIKYVHGHDGAQSTLDHVYNVDTDLGKVSRAKVEMLVAEGKAELVVLKAQLAGTITTSLNSDYLEGRIAEIEKELTENTGSLGLYKGINSNESASLADQQDENFDKMCKFTQILEKAFAEFSTNLSSDPAVEDKKSQYQNALNDAAFAYSTSSHGEQSRSEFKDAINKASATFINGAGLNKDPTVWSWRARNFAKVVVNICSTVFTLGIVNAINYKFTGQALLFSKTKAEEKTGAFNTAFFKNAVSVLDSKNNPSEPNDEPPKKNSP